VRIVIFKKSVILGDFLCNSSTKSLIIFILRWAPENKSKMNPNAWMPFGMGPRNCVGMRFALEEAKLALAVLIKQFRFFPVEETPVSYLYFLFINSKY